MRGFRLFVEAADPLYGQLMSLRPLIAKAAQAIYDEWEQEDQCDLGGICDEIAREVMGIIAQHAHCEVTDGGHDGDDHAWVIAYNKNKAYGVDIPPETYETGGGYCWKKIPNVTFKPTDVHVWDLQLSPEHISQLG